MCVSSESVAKVYDVSGGEKRGGRGVRETVTDVCVYVQSELPVIFLPTHRSHLDYILIAFILFSYDIRTPLVAAGDNLLIPVFGYVVHSVTFHNKMLEIYPTMCTNHFTASRDKFCNASSLRTMTMWHVTKTDKKYFRL